VLNFRFATALVRRCGETPTIDDITAILEEQKVRDPEG
jgi:hypothetical protein